MPISGTYDGFNLRRPPHFPQVSPIAIDMYRDYSIYIESARVRGEYSEMFYRFRWLISSPIGDYLDCSDFAYSDSYEALVWAKSYIDGIREDVEGKPF